MIATKSSVFDSKFSLFTGFSPSNSSNQTWQETLERAQNALFCKEIYNQVFIIITLLIFNLKIKTY